MRLEIPACIAFALAACDQGTLGSSSTPRLDAGGQPDVGNGPLDSGPPPAFVTLRLYLPSTTSFCDPQQIGVCFDNHITIRTAAGQRLSVDGSYNGSCPIMCSIECLPPPCGDGICVLGGGVITQVEKTWNGWYYESSTCGQGLGCYIPHVAPPGHYVAQMCATPGMIVEGDAGQSSCAATGPQQCIDVPFDYPGPSPIEVTLP